MRSLLVSAVSTNQTSPSPACVSWMCDPHLTWRVWRLESLVVWSYHTKPGHTIPTWGQCFTATGEEEEGQWRHEVGLMSRVTEERVVYVPSVNCQDKVHMLSII